MMIYTPEVLYLNGVYEFSSYIPAGLRQNVSAR